MSDLPPTLGLRHLALWVPSARFDATLRFYREGLGMAIDWQPDPDNVYLSSGGDNLALHRVPEAGERRVELQNSPLDHLGFAMPTAAAVDAWWAHLEPRAAAFELEIVARPRRHRDGATSFYFKDPAGHTVQMLHIPSLRP
jgi:catechol 2,3-dioxygenase-like lactoylglutathione lyase family enzyme